MSELQLNNLKPAAGAKPAAAAGKAGKAGPPGAAVAELLVNCRYEHML